jgi:hypothetical protein
MGISGSRASAVDFVQVYGTLHEGDLIVQRVVMSFDRGNESK